MIRLEALIEAIAPLGGELIGRAGAESFTGFAHDSRTVAPGALFVALRTAKADGHDYLDDAVARGATGVLCERPPENTERLRAAGATIVRVPNTRAALTAYARATLARLRTRQIVIAGAVGKSSARHALIAALGGGDAIFSNGDHNDELGLPLALGELDERHTLAVIEVAAANGGELSRLATLLTPDVVLLTTAAPPDAADPASLAFRQGLPALLARLDAGEPGERMLLVNADDPDLAALLTGCPPPAHTRVVRYSSRSPEPHDSAPPASGSADGKLAAYSQLSPADMPATGAPDAEATSAQRSLRRSSPPSLGEGPGERFPAARAAAIAGARLLGVPEETASARLQNLPPLPGRLASLAGRDKLALLDDTVSASAASLAYALQALCRLPRPHAAVLGEISGVATLAALDEPAAQTLLQLDLLVLQGRETAALARDLRARAAAPAGILTTYSARDSADAVLAWARLRPNERPTVLIKGSDAARMERVVELLLPDDGRAGAPLLRQDEGWRRRTYVPTERPTWVEIDLGAIRDNLQALRVAAGNAEVMAVLKADAYGHGARWVARTAALNGAAMLGVASLNEALDLRADGIGTPILILGYAPPWQGRELALSDIQAAIFSENVAEQFSRAAADLGRRIGVHVKIDTGMTRLGVAPEEALPFVERLRRLPGLDVVGIFSHLATSDSDPAFAREQGERFAAALAQLQAAGHSFRHIHVENSAAVLRGLPFSHTMVRAGLALYGLYPLPCEETATHLRPALAWKTRVAQVKSVPAGTGVSYGRSFVTRRPSRIAVLPVGYGDGFRRSPQNAGVVLVRGRRAPVVGAVNMDMAMIDVTDVPGVEEGDEAVLIGAQGEDAISAEEMAAALGTISYEVVTQIMPRVPRQLR